MTALLWLGLGLLLLPRTGRAAAHRSSRVLRGGRRESPRMDVGELPAVLDLAAVALRSGAPPGTALAAAASATTGPLHTVLVGVAGLLALGVDPAAAWSDARAVPELATVALLAERSGSSGARLADVLAATAATLRDDAVASGRRAAARVGVWAVLPLGLCFLPAFVCVGIVPAVIGIAGGLAGDALF